MILSIELLDIAILGAGLIAFYAFIRSLRRYDRPHPPTEAWLNKRGEGWCETCRGVRALAHDCAATPGRLTVTSEAQQSGEVSIERRVGELSVSRE